MNRVAHRKNFFDIFPPPEYLLLSTCGIVVTDRNVRFAELKRGILGEGFRLATSKKYPNAKGAVEDGVVINPAEVAKTLKQIASEYGVQYARGTLPDERSFIFTTAIDAVAPKDLRDAVAFIIEEHVPVSLTESVFDFDVVGRDATTGKIKIVVSVVPQTLVEGYIEAFESAGITPTSFDIESQAITRAVLPRCDRRAHLIVNSSDRKTAFYVVEDEVVQFSTTVAHGADAGPEGVKIETKKVLGFWSDRPDPLGKSAKKIEKVIVCGVGAQDPGFLAHVLDGLDVESGKADVFANLLRPKETSAGLSGNAAEFASAIGLILPKENRKNV